MKGMLKLLGAAAMLGLLAMPVMAVDKAQTRARDGSQIKQQQRDRVGSQDRQQDQVRNRDGSCQGGAGPGGGDRQQIRKRDGSCGGTCPNGGEGQRIRRRDGSCVAPK